LIRDAHRAAQQPSPCRGERVARHKNKDATTRNDSSALNTYPLLSFLWLFSLLLLLLLP
jgi:hypothetical protein